LGSLNIDHQQYRFGHTKVRFKARHGWNPRSVVPKRIVLEF
jgi:hypothetical protein